MGDAILDLDLIRHERETDYRRLADAAVVARDSMLSYYRHIQEPMRLPDLLGMLKVGPEQHPHLSDEVVWLSEAIGIEPPPMFVYQPADVVNHVNAEGLSRHWLEMSAYALNDFSPSELRFCIARELIHIRNEYTTYEILIRTMIDATKYIHYLPTVGAMIGGAIPEKLARGLEIVMFRYIRAAQHTADRGALLLIGSLETACRAVMKSSLRSRQLSDDASLSAWYAQNKEIDSMTGFIATYTKLNEYMPYGPKRLQDLVAFCSRRSTKSAFGEIAEYCKGRGISYG